MNCIIRNAQMSDYDSVVRILNQGQALHINWRPDIYKPNDALLPKAVFEEIVKGDTFYIAENEGNVIGILELIFRHIESPAQVTRDIVFIDTMAVDEPYRGMGVGHLFFEKVKEIKAKKRLEGIELQVNAKIRPLTRCTVITDLRKNPLIWNYCKNYIYLKKDTYL